MKPSIESARNGDRSAFARLVEDHHASVCAITTSILADPVAGEDAAQETFLIGWRKLHQLDDPERFPGWLHQIARNTARMHRRSARRRPDGVVAGAIDAAEPGPSADRALEEAETERVLAQAVAELPEEVREVLVLYYREGRSTSEVASRLALSEAAVRKRLSRARETLKADVEARFGGWMERTRPRAAVVAAVLVALAAAPPPAHAAPGRPGRPGRPAWRLGAALVCGVSAAWLLSLWMAPDTDGSRSEAGVRSPPVSVAMVAPGERPAPPAEPTPQAEDPVLPSPAEDEPAPGDGVAIREALFAFARAGGQRVVQCDVSALGVSPAVMVSGLESAFPPAVDVSDGVLTLVVAPSEYRGATVAFGDGTLALDVEPGGPGAVSPCTARLAPPFDQTEFEIPNGEALTAQVDESMALEVEKQAEHDEGVSPLQLALEDPALSAEARRLIESWVEQQGEEREARFRRAEMWASHPEMTLILTRPGEEP